MVDLKRRNSPETPNSEGFDAEILRPPIYMGGGFRRTPATAFSGAENQHSEQPEPHQSGADESLRRLLDAADMACQFWGDSKHARAEMRRQLREVPVEDRQTWTEHFQTVYGTGGAS